MISFCYMAWDTVSLAASRNVNNSISLSQTSMSAGTGTANIAVLMSPAPSPVSVNLVSSWQETTVHASVSETPSATDYKTQQSQPCLRGQAKILLKNPNT